MAPGSPREEAQEPRPRCTFGRGALWAMLEGRRHHDLTDAPFFEVEDPLFECRNNGPRADLKALRRCYRTEAAPVE